ncbi:MAG: hypothetical protein HYY76_16180, partial [Acidobacteria bacterium]|nr:hypothetical protein [Acidobacteriota bacterium]
MRLPDRAAPTPPLPSRRLLRIAATGAAAALLLWLLGRGVEVIVLGGDGATARQRVEADVRGSFDAMARTLRLMALGMADAPSVVAATGGNVTAARRLFEAADAALAQVGAPTAGSSSRPARWGGVARFLRGGVEAQDVDYAVTAYGADGQPLAWDGRPSELPPDRLQGDEAWFFTRGALGLRLVYVTPVLTGSGERVGTVAAEQSLSLAAPPPADGDVFRYASRLAPVSLELRFESGRPTRSGHAFDVPAPSGSRLLTATLDPADLDRTRERWRRASQSLALTTFALSLVLLCGPLLDWRNRLRRARPHAAAVALIAAIVVVARLLLRIASPADWSDASIFSGAEYASPLLRPLLTSPFDFLLTAIAASGLVALLLYAAEAWRITRWPASATRAGRDATRPASAGWWSATRTPWRGHAGARVARAGGHYRHRIDSTRAILAFAAVQLAAGAALALLLAAYHAFLRDTVANTTLDLLHYSLHPWSTTRLALQVGLIVWHATALGAGVLLLRLAVVPWSIPRPDWRFRAGTIGFWALPLLVWQLVAGVGAAQRIALLIALTVVIALVTLATRLEARYRHGSQSFRLNMLTLGLVVPAVAFYPSMFELGWEAKTQLVETRFAPQAVNHRQTIQRLLQDSLAQIDRFPGLADLVTVPASPAGGEAPTDRAFQVWRITDLARYPVTSAVELYDANGFLVSRFAFNLPADLTAASRSDERACT